MCEEIFPNNKLYNKPLILKNNDLNSIMNVNGLIEMAWSDEATFTDIEREFGIKEPEVKRIMQTNLKPSSYRLWRKRVRWIKEKRKRSL